MRFALLEQLPEQDVQQVISIARRRRFARGEVVFHQGDPADTLHLIIKGKAAVRVATSLGDAAILAVLGRGEMFGELALIGGESRRSATVVALEPTETHSVHQIDFERLRREHPDLVSNVLIAILSGQVRRLSEQLLEALHVPADKRVRRRLLAVAEVYGDDDGMASADVTVPLTQDDLADLAGTSRATVNRVLREEEDRGTVALSRGRTTIRDADALARRGR
jgi:CRP/FNR family cyclic AMP-dependent transcriptional regulator